jgi:hypothetical protein
VDFFWTARARRGSPVCLLSRGVESLNKRHRQPLVASLRGLDQLLGLSLAVSPRLLDEVMLLALMGSSARVLYGCSLGCMLT